MSRTVDGTHSRRRVLTSIVPQNAEESLQDP